jgi:two-component system, chemotaxis family, protein-glutamate methylesterase/glutaminase
MSSIQNLKHSVPKKIVLIGASTGGPGQIQKIISSLPNLRNTTIVIAQHMVDGFIESFAKRLQKNHHNPISIVQNRQLIENSNIYMIDGETKVDCINNELFFNKKPAPQHSYNPNINILFNSFLPLSENTKILSVILTGIGEDGVDACKNLSKSGVRCITESKESAIIDGMPNRAREEVMNIEIYHMDEIVQIIKEFCQ